MEASHHSVSGAGFVVLYEIYFGNLLVKDLLVVAFEEIASCIFEDAGLEDYWAFYVGFDYIHFG